MITPITATFPTLNFPKEVDYPTQEDWAAFSAAAELNYGILSGAWSDKSEEFKEQTNNLAQEIRDIGENAINAITFDNIAQLKLNSNMNRIDVLGYYSKGDGGGGTFYWDSTSTEANNDGTIIQATGITTGRWKRVISGAINVKWFGAIRLSESTVAIQNAFNFVASINGTIEISDLYLVDTIKLTGVNGFAMIGKGALIGTTTVLRDAVLEFKNCTDVTAPKTLTISGNHNENYTAGVKVWAEMATGTSSLCVLKFNINGAKLAWQFGDLSEPDVLLSEMSIGEGCTYGCPKCLLAIGTQTVIGITDYQLISGLNGGSGSWLTLDRYIIKSIGSRVQQNGGEQVITDVINYACNVLEPIESPSFENSYGKIILSNVEIESSSQLLITRNPLNVSNTTKGLFSVSQSGGYHSQNAFPFLQTEDDFKGEVSVQQCDFYGGTFRTQPTLLAGDNTNIYIDEESFKTNFPESISGISGGKLHFSNRQIAYYNNLVSQVIPLFTTANLKFVSVVNGTSFNRFNGDYNSATGVFTVPRGGLKGVLVSLKIASLDLTPTSCEVYVSVNGTPYAVTNGTTYVAISCFLGDLVEGDTIDTKINNITGVNITMNSYATDTFQISAWN